MDDMLARTQFHKEEKYMSLGQVFGNTLLHSFLSIPIYLLFSIVEAGAIVPFYKSISLGADSFLSSSLFNPLLTAFPEYFRLLVPAYQQR